MSNGAMPKATSSKSLVQNRYAEEQCDMFPDDLAFELKPKPKLTCIPEHCSNFLNGLRQTQSAMNVAINNDAPEKSWSVLFIGSKTNVRPNRFFM